MTPTMPDSDDRAIDALIESVSRADAPRDFASRVSVAIDARNSGVGLGGHLHLVSAASAVALVAVIGMLWMGTSRHATPAPPATVAHETPAAVPRVPAAPEPLTPQIAADAQAPGDGRHATRRPRRRKEPEDHERALAALARVPDVEQNEISPRSIDTVSIDVTPMNAIAPLTVQGGRDTSGRGDFR
jgi:hypothetical protein